MIKVTDTGSSVHVDLGNGKYIELGYVRDEELEAVRFLVPDEALKDLIDLANGLAAGARLA